MEVGLASGAARDELFSGTVPTFGVVRYVDATNGDDTVHDGLSMDRAFKTILVGYNAMAANQHDVLVLSAAGGHTLTDELAMSKSRTHIIGLDPAGSRVTGQRTRITMGVTTGSAISAILITATGCSLQNLKITSADTLSTSLYTVADGGEFTVIRNCWLEKNTDLDQTTAAEMLANGDTSYYHGVTFGNGIYTVAAARQSVLATRETITGKVARSCVWDECTFLSRCNSTTFVNVRATTNDFERETIFHDCHFEAVKTSPVTQNEGFGIASALTDARVTISGARTAFVGITHMTTASSGVFSSLPVANELGGKVTEAT